MEYFVFWMTAPAIGERPVKALSKLIIVVCKACNMAASILYTPLAGAWGRLWNILCDYVWSLSHRQGRPFPDPLVKVYDIRTMRPLPPIPFSDGPAFINILPKRSSSLVITSNHGLVNIVNVLNPNSGSEFYQVRLAIRYHLLFDRRHYCSWIWPLTLAPSPCHQQVYTWHLAMLTVPFISWQPVAKMIQACFGPKWCWCMH